MKKITLIALIMLSALVQVKAQAKKQTIASTSNTLSASNSVIKDDLSFNLSTDPEKDGTVKDYIYYMQKKKNNLSAGLVTLGLGVIFSGLGVIIGSNTDAFDDEAVFPAALLIAGGVSGIVSIPLMIMATVYGHKAKVELSKQRTGFGVPPGVSHDITGLTLKIPIGK